MRMKIRLVAMSVLLVVRAPHQRRTSRGLTVSTFNHLPGPVRMKPSALLLTLCLLLAAATNLCADLSTGLEAYYPLNGNANDVSGNGRHGTAISGLSYVADPRGTVAYFNGNSQYISRPNSISNYADLSVTFWVKTSDYNLNGFPSGIFLVSRDIPSFANDWSICLGQGRKMQFVTIEDVLATTNDIGANEWVHIACVADSASQLKRIFLDGQQAASTSWSPFAFANNSVPIFLGASTADTSSHAFFTGSLADVRFYNRALSTSEVQQVYANESFCTPHKATATAVLVNGFVVGATITGAGCGYTNAPTVLIQGGGGIGAAATATVIGGQVTAINITDAGCCYTNLPLIVIGSPPFVPTVSIAVSKVKVTQNVVLGRTYVLETSTDLVTWTATGPQFTADSETIVTEFDVDAVGRFFRIRQVP
jgi:hypothetical protein